jgi:hypothetical protein
MKENLIIIFFILFNQIHGQQPELIAGHVVSSFVEEEKK